MKRLICALLALALLASCLAGCDRRPVQTDAASPTDAGANFDPETTAVAYSELPQDTGLPTAEAQADASGEAAQDVIEDQMVVQDATVAQDGAASATPDAAQASEAAAIDATSAPQPFATATPQPNASVSSYAEVAASGLGFRFSYPADWTNIPGRSTVCYVQPVGDGTVYPARVAVTMKRLSHRCNRDSNSEHKSELADYLKVLMTQYDEDSFSVNMTLDETTQFMGNAAISTTYLAYDGEQEIQGYVILTYFDRYLFVYHFLCAYEDYAAFEPAMRHMRDSVQADQNLLDS